MRCTCMIENLSFNVVLSDLLKPVGRKEIVGRV